MISCITMQLMSMAMAKRFMIDQYTFELSDKYLSKEEQSVFDDSLNAQGTGSHMFVTFKIPESGMACVQL